MSDIGVECLQDPLTELERVRQERDALRLETERLRVRDHVTRSTSVLHDCVSRLFVQSVDIFT